MLQRSAGVLLARSLARQQQHQRGVHDRDWSVRRRRDAWSVAQASEGSGLNYGRLVSLDACAGGALRCTKVRRLLMGTASWGSPRAPQTQKFMQKAKPDGPLSRRA